MNSVRNTTVMALMTAAVLTRLAPHPSNVAPMAALALFGAATFSSRLAAGLVPMIALLLSDLALELAHRAGWSVVAGFYPGQWVVYACTAATVAIGFLLRVNRTAPRIAAATLVSSVLFFLVTNLAWAYGPWSLYPKTLQGVLMSYQMALPFFRNSLIGDAAYSFVLFGGLAYAESWLPAIRGRQVGQSPA